jgi:phosphoribosylglycinamide formyltransferase-1
VNAAAPLSLAVLISGRGSNMAAIAAACAAGRIDARIACVIADTPGATGLELARGLGLQAVVVDRRRHADRPAFERALAEAVDASGAGLVVLAGFMRILGSAFVQRYAGRLLNIHPSLLPKYPGLDTHARALAAGDLEHGATVHYATAELDAGPAILQGVVPVLPADTVDSLSARVHAAEHIIYPQVIGWIAAGRLAMKDGEAWLDGRRLESPVRLDPVRA